MSDGHLRHDEVLAVPKVALYVAAAVFALVAVVHAVFFVLGTEVLVGGSLFREINLIALAILSAALAGWMVIASRDL